MKILIAGFQHETNTFSPTKASYSSFVQGEGFPPMVRSDDVLGLRDVNVPIGGFIKAMQARGRELKPVIWAGASASAHVTTEAFERIGGEILAAVEDGGFDAIYLGLHGAMVTVDVADLQRDDFTGAQAGAVRDRQRSLVFQVAGGSDQATHFVRTEHDGQRAWHTHRLRPRHQVGLMKRDLEEELQSGDRGVQRNG